VPELNAINKSHSMPANHHLPHSPVHACISKWLQPNTQDVNTPTEKKSFTNNVPTINPNKTIRLILQNPQCSFQLGHDNSDIYHTLEQLKQKQASMVAISSPNINWHNASNVAAFKRPFRNLFQYMHLSYTASDLGKHTIYRRQPNLTGGAAITSIDQWASRIISQDCDPRGHGTYTSTTYSGKNNNKLTVICAYIAVPKGINMGETSFYPQQIFVMEKQCITSKKTCPKKYCPRIEAIKSCIITLLNSRKRITSSY